MTGSRSYDRGMPSVKAKARLIIGPGLLAFGKSVPRTNPVALDHPGRFPSETCDWQDNPPVGGWCVGWRTSTLSVSPVQFAPTLSARAEKAKGDEIF